MASIRFKKNIAHSRQIARKQRVKNYVTHGIENVWTNEQKVDLKWLRRHKVVTKSLATKKTAGPVLNYNSKIWSNWSQQYNPLKLTASDKQNKIQDDQEKNKAESEQNWKTTDEKMRIFLKKNSVTEGINPNQLQPEKLLQQGAFWQQTPNLQKTTADNKKENTTFDKKSISRTPLKISGIKLKIKRLSI